MIAAQQSYDAGLVAGFSRAGVPVDRADDDVYRRGYRHGERAFRRLSGSFLPCPERPSQGGYVVAPPVDP